MNHSSAHGRERNRLLNALLHEQYERVLRQVEHISVVVTQTLYRTGDSNQYVYFPEDSVVAIFSRLKNGSIIELALAGQEGMIGGGGILSPQRRITNNHAVVLAEGSAVRMKIEDFARALMWREAFRELLLEYNAALLQQVYRMANWMRMPLAGIVEAMGTFQQRALISYADGHIRILN